MPPKRRSVVFSEPLAQDPARMHWTRMNLPDEEIGRWEVTYDEPRWQQDGVLQMVYQTLPGSGVSYGALNNSTPVSEPGPLDGRATDEL